MTMTESALKDALSRFRSLYVQLVQDTPYSALLDSCGWTGKTGGLYVMAFEAIDVIQLHGRSLTHNGTLITEINSAESLWKELNERFPQATSPKQTPYGSLPFEDGWIGALGYELASVLEPTIPERACENLMGELLFIRFRHRIVWQPEREQFSVLSDDPTWVEQIEALWASGDLSHPAQHHSSYRPGAVNSSFDEPSFHRAVEAIKTEISDGNLYQANVSMRFSVDAPCTDELLNIYLKLVERNPSPFSGILMTPFGAIVSNSPERLVKYSPDTNIIETRPIAGTRGRGKTPGETAAIDSLLLNDPKEQAEHAMLVDLERNDIGRVCRAGSVHVPELSVLEKYSHVTHLVSQVEGEKSPEATPWDILSATFPGGTITGCPKVRCMQLLHELEPVPRGFYTGSLGYLDWRGGLDFNILIRSLFSWPSGRMDFHAGAGIVHDSLPEGEYKECFRKTQALQGVLNDDQPCHTR